MTEPHASAEGDAGALEAPGAVAPAAGEAAAPPATAPATARAADERADEPEDGAGARLARARAALGLSIEDVARQLKFAPRQIEALEAERYEVLPGGAAVRGMVRSYARLLHIEAAPLLEAMAGRLDVPDADRLVARYGEPVPFSDGARRSTFVYVALSAVVLVAAALVLLQWRQGPPQATQMSFVPAARAPLEPARTAVASAGPSGVPSERVIPPVEAPNPVPEAAAAAPVAKPEPVAKPAPAPQAGTVAAAAGSHRIALRFERASWVEVHDGAGRVLMSKVNAPESEVVLTGEPPFTLVIGNAQYVRLTYDAKVIDLEPHIKVAVARLTLP